jgi:tRNA threonylcarbamoyladenosine biosynthesis protein TsaE
MFLQTFSVWSDSVEATGRLAEELAVHLRPGSALCLLGDLGAGKTSFVAALCRALGSEAAASSPSFTLENRYPIPGMAGEFVHLDLYRPGEAGDPMLLASALEAREAGAIVAVEWGEPWVKALRPCLRIEFLVENGRREIYFTADPEGWRPFELLRSAWQAVCG